MGSGGGRRSGGARGGSADRVSNCDSVNIEALLASPQPNVLAQVRYHDSVEIRLDSSTGRNIVQVRWRGDLLGTLTVNGLDRLIDCLQQGYLFHGVVTEVRGALCKIWIRSEDGAT